MPDTWTTLSPRAILVRELSAPVRGSQLVSGVNTTEKVSENANA